MGTLSVIIRKEKKSGLYQAVEIQYDGYLSYVGLELLENIKTYDDTNELFKLTQLRSLNFFNKELAYKLRLANNEHPNDKAILYKSRTSKHKKYNTVEDVIKDTVWTYVYLFTDDNKWMFRRVDYDDIVDSDKFKLLTMEEIQKDDDE